MKLNIDKARIDLGILEEEELPDAKIIVTAVEGFQSELNQDINEDDFSKIKELANKYFPSED